MHIRQWSSAASKRVSIVAVFSLPSNSFRGFWFYNFFSVAVQSAKSISNALPLSHYET
jgi:hypothetical protein